MRGYCVMSKWRNESILDAYNLVLGAFLFVSPWLFAFSYGPARLDTWTTGILVVAVSIAALVAFAEWEEWVSLILGVWMIASPWLLRFPHAAAMKVSIGVGLLVTYFSLLELWLLHYDQSRERAPH
jgi:SPW repeat